MCLVHAHSRGATKGEGAVLRCGKEDREGSPLSMPDKGTQIVFAYTKEARNAGFMPVFQYGAPLFPSGHGRRIYPERLGQLSLAPAHLPALCT